MEVFEPDAGKLRESKGNFVRTKRGGIAHLNASLIKAKNIGHSSERLIIHEDVVLEGDLQTITLGDSVILHKSARLRPAEVSAYPIDLEEETQKKTKHSVFNRDSKFPPCYPMTIGDYVTIGENSMVSCRWVPAFCRIGDNVIISSGCTIGHCCDIVSGSILVPGTVVPPYTRFAGSPAKFVENVPQCWKETRIEEINKIFECYKPVMSSVK